MTYSLPYSRMLQTYVSPRRAPNGPHGQIEGAGVGKTNDPKTWSRCVVEMTFDNAKFVIDNCGMPRRTCARAGTLCFQLYLLGSRTTSDLILTRVRTH